MTNKKNIEERVNALEQKVSKLEGILAVGTHEDHKANSSGKKLTVKEFVLGKNLKGDVQKTLIIAYYLEKYENMLSVNVDDLAKYLRLAKEPVPSNLNDKINMNIRKGHVAEAEEKKDGKKAWYLTSTGENYVEQELKK